MRWIQLTQLLMGDDHLVIDKSMADTEKRRHRRLQIQLPLEFYPECQGRPAACRTLTRDISSGGLYFEIDGAPPEKGTPLHLELTIPPGAHFPYEGRVKSAAHVVRIERIESPDDENANRPDRFGIGARLEHWQVAF